MPKRPGNKKISAELDILENLEKPTLEDIKKVYDLLSRQKEPDLQMNCSMTYVWPRLSKEETMRTILFFKRNYSNENVAFDRNPFEDIRLWTITETQMPVFAELLDDEWFEHICVKSAKKIKFGKIDKSERVVVMEKILSLTELQQ